MRDYLYIPLGGNRLGVGRTYFNLMLTMLLGGLWHGASWTFVVWGGLHGTYLIVERLLSRRTSAEETLQPLPVVAQSTLVPGITSIKNIQLVFGMLLTFFLVNITWVFFRSPDFATAGRMLASMFGVIPQGATMLSSHDLLKVYTVMAVLVLLHWRMRDTDLVTALQRIPWWATALLWTAMSVMLLLSQQTGDSFIYFQF